MQNIAMFISAYRTPAGLFYLALVLAFGLALNSVSDMAVFCGSFLLIGPRAIRWVMTPIEPFKSSKEG